MSAFVIANMAPLMFASLVVFLLLGYPVAFTLAFTGLFWGIVGIQLGVFQPNLFQAMPERILGVISNETLLAIPFFTLMGLILERSGMAEELLETIAQLFGPIPGGIAYAVIFVGALLAATTGVVAASVIAMGLIALPIMLRTGYDRALASGVIAASGTLAQIIPPSLVLIVLADQLGKPVGEMYVGALVPGLMLTGFYALYVLGMTIFKRGCAPALPPEARLLRGRALLLKVCITLLPPLVLIFLVLGTIYIGLASPTAGGAMGAVGALALAAAKGRLSGRVLVSALDQTATLCAFVMFILIGARLFSLTFYGVHGDKWVEHLLLSVGGDALTFLIVVNILVFLVAFFLDFFEIAFILVPLLAPVAAKLGIDLVWFGVILGINMQTSFMHPPFGFALFYLRSVAPNAPYVDKVTRRTIAPVTTGQIYRGAIPFVVIQVLMVGLTIAFPGLVTHYKDTAAEIPTTVMPAAPPAAGQPPVVTPDGPNFGTGPKPQAPLPDTGAPPPPNFGAPPRAETPAPNFGTPPSAPKTPEPAPPPPNFGSGPAK